MRRNWPELAGISRKRPASWFYKGFHRAPRPRPVGSITPLALRVVRSSRTRRELVSCPSRARTSRRASPPWERRINARIEACCSVKSLSVCPNDVWPLLRNRTVTQSLCSSISGRGKPAEVHPAPAARQRAGRECRRGDSRRVRPSVYADAARLLCETRLMSSIRERHSGVNLHGRRVVGVTAGIDAVVLRLVRSGPSAESPVRRGDAVDRLRRLGRAAWLFVCRKPCRRASCPEH